jgi:hypothetical protein
LACSPPSDPTSRAIFFERGKGLYRFWAVVLGEEIVTAEARSSRPAYTVAGLRVRIIESVYAELGESRDFTFAASAIGPGCEQEYGPLSTARYPVGMEVQIGTDDFVRAKILGVSRTAAMQCPEAVPASGTKTINHGQTESVVMPRSIPAGYTGCQYTWVRDVGSLAPMQTLWTTYFVGGSVRWHGTSERLCMYEAGQLDAKKSFAAEYCPLFAVDALRPGGRAR